MVLLNKQHVLNEYHPSRQLTFSKNIRIFSDFYKVRVAFKFGNNLKIICI